MDTATVKELATYVETARNNWSLSLLYLLLFSAPWLFGWEDWPAVDDLLFCDEQQGFLPLISSFIAMWVTGVTRWPLTFLHALFFRTSWRSSIRYGKVQRTQYARRLWSLAGYLLFPTLLLGFIGWQFFQSLLIAGASSSIFYLALFFAPILIVAYLYAKTLYFTDYELAFRLAKRIWFSVRGVATFDRDGYHPGEQVAFRFTNRDVLASNKAYNITMAYVHETIQRKSNQSGKRFSQQVNREILFSAEQEVAPIRADRGINFRIPGEVKHNIPLTIVTSEKDRHFWEVTVTDLDRDDLVGQFFFEVTSPQSGPDRGQPASGGTEQSNSKAT